MHRRDQNLDAWVSMLHELYGYSQNYSRSAFEIHSHLAEVTGLVGKFLVRKKELAVAVDFLAKTFAWLVALYRKVEPQRDLSEVILRKFPFVCPYCRKSPCSCWEGDAKPEIDRDKLRALYYNVGCGVRCCIECQASF